MPNPVITGTQNNAAIAAANTSATVTSTGSVTQGNLQIVAIEVSGATAPTGITAPAGWTTLLATTVTEISGLVSAAIFSRVATATGAFSGSFTWTTSSTGGEWLFMEWAGVGTPVMVTLDGPVATNLNSSTTTPFSPAIPPSAVNFADTDIVLLFGGALSATTITIPTGTTSILAIAGSATQPLLGAASLTTSSNTIVSAQFWTLGTAQAVLGVSILLQQNPMWGFADASTSHTQAIPFRNPARRGYAAAAMMVGDTGIEATKINFFNPGWPIQPVQPPISKPTARRYSATKGKSEFAIFATLPNMDQMAQPPQPPHRPFIAAATMRGDDGIEAAFIPPAATVVRWGFDPTPPFQKWKARSTFQSTEAAFIPLAQPILWVDLALPTLARRRPTSMHSLDHDGVPSALVNWFNIGWEAILHQPLHPRTERSGAVAIGDTGIEVPPPLPPIITSGWGFSPELPLFSVNPKISQRYSATKGKSEFAIFPQFLPSGFEVQSVQPRYKNFRGAVFAKGDDSPAPIAAAVIVTTGWGFEVQSPILRIWAKLSQRGAGASGESSFAASSTQPWTDDPAWQPYFRRRTIDPRPIGTEAPFIPPAGIVTSNWGFDAQPYQPQRILRKGGGIMPREDGNESPLINWFNAGWAVQPIQPNHPLPERFAGIAPLEPGIEAAFIPPPVLLPYALDTYLMVRFRPVRDPLQQWNGDPTQPLTQFLPFGWPIQPPQPPHPSPERRAGAIMPREDGSGASKINWFNFGWEIQPVQPPHGRPERSAALIIEDRRFDPQIFVPITYLASLQAIERGDFFLGVLSQFNVPLSAYVSIIENLNQSSIVGTPPEFGVAGARVAIITGT